MDGKLSGNLNIDGRLSGVGNVSGNLSKPFTLTGSLLGDTIKGTLTLGSSLSGSISRPSNRPPTYTGECEVVPKAHEQTVLQTSGLVMADDVTVFEIPYFETSNTNGTTVYIANEV